MNITRSWKPTPEHLSHSNAGKLCQALGLKTFSQLYDWSVRHPEEFWSRAIAEMGIRFTHAPARFLNWNRETAFSSFLEGAEMNIAESCFLADPAAMAVVEVNEAGGERKLSFAELKAASLDVAAAFYARGLSVNDRIAIDMPMSIEAVLAYLGALWLGAQVVSIADSFAPSEINTRLRITHAKLVVTQDVVTRGGKTLPMFEKVAEAGATPAIVVRTTPGTLALRDGDAEWTDFLASKDRSWSESKKFGGPASHWINILFSSGTTGDPKAIPWTQSTPLKCAVDARYHHDIQAGDVLCWPTNLGWMMGPWLLFAGLLNKAAIALYTGSPLDAGFANFISKQRVTMLGLVPSLLKSWRQNKIFESIDLSSLKLFSSSGECSNADDMAYLMGVDGNTRPIIEYCGGTEIGGAYLSSSVMEENIPSQFTTPTLGLGLLILDEQGEECDNGELFLVPPSLGLSTELLVAPNKSGVEEHYSKYYADCPKGPNGETLRRHGDQLIRLDNGYYQALGRVDDTMNLGGIKVSSAEIERVLLESGLVKDCAAIAIHPPGGGPSQLVIYSVKRDNFANSAPDVRLGAALQQVIREKLNPLFKIQDVREVESLPRTASNKVMRRVLRDEYVKARDT